MSADRDSPEPSNASGDSGSGVSSLVQRARRRVEGKRAEAEAKLKEVMAEKKQKLDAMIAEPKARAEEKVAVMALRFIKKGLGRVRDNVKLLVVDPYMPQFLQQWVGGLVDDLWPEVETEVLMAVMKRHAEPDDIVEDLDPVGCCVCNPIIARLRYFLHPYDKSFWHQMRNPLFVLYKMAMLVPAFGIQQFLFGLQFFVIDRSDEYQLVNYILDFKRLLFFTAGLIGCVVASAMFYMCSQELTGREEDPPCSLSSPRESVWAMSGVLVQCVVVWIAFCQVSGAVPKGALFYLKKLRKKNEASRHNSDAGGLGFSGPSRDPSPDSSPVHAAPASGRKMEKARGVVDEILAEENEEQFEQRRVVIARRMMYMLVYDMFVAALCVGLVCWFVFAGPDEPIHEKDGYRFDYEYYNVTDNTTATHTLSLTDSVSFGIRGGPRSRGRRVNETYDEDWQEEIEHWRFETTLYMARCLYGLGSFPFFLFSMPVLMSLMTHSKRTGYTRTGQCVKFIGEPQEEPRQTTMVEVRQSDEGTHANPEQQEQGQWAQRR